ncbi:relaxase/mobilization nuclease domain-containing protein [Photobacterium frigidiphilum]|uniref:TraI/MobA(P) family conjugative relaxase n=1 Tax=Photobacterium frigidiphilum TaxID=264736 RepID=UPI003D0F5227
MMAKKVPSPKSKRDVRFLVLYAIDVKDNGKKVGDVFINNCYSLEPLLALKEIEIIQDRNVRAKSDKTFHMVVSFPHDEIPMTEQLNDIEQSLCESVGLGHHQRISATHINTDNYHLHVVINKIDPDTYKIVDKYRDAIALMAKCAELEKQHGLKLEHWNEKDNQLRHTDNIIDHFSGEQSLLSWCSENIKDELEDTLTKASRWSDVHRVLNQNGLKLERAGSGLVIKTTDDKAAIKASSLSRNLSLKKLESTLGPFSSPSTTKSRQPSRYVNDKNDYLYTAFQKHKQEQAKNRKARLATLKQTAARQRLTLRVEHALAREKLKATALSGYLKRDAYKRLSANHKVAQKIVTTHYANERKKAFEQHPSMTFRDYLQWRALDGHKASLIKLRYKQPNLSATNGITGEGDKFLSAPSKTIDKHGHVHYQYHGQTVRDDGRQLSASDDAVSVKPLVEMAILKYGRDIIVQGDDTFKRKVEACITDNGLNVRLAGMKSPLEDFIDKRNKDREKITSIPIHKPFTEKQSGTFSFEGYRNVRDESVVLLKQRDTMYVKSFPRSELGYYKSLHKGVSLSLNPQRGHEQDNEWER